MNYAQTIQYLYPPAIALADYSCATLGDGTQQIVKWNTAKLGPQPSEAQLEAAWPAAQLQQAKTTQRALIKSSFIAASTANVTDSNGIVWEGGMQSGNSIFLGCQLAQQAGQSTITLYDASKAPHSMTIAEGMGVAALIGGEYQTALATKNGLYAQIDAAGTVAAVQAVVWP